MAPPLAPRDARDPGTASPPGSESAARRVREIELKLSLDPEDVARLRRHPRLRALATGRTRTRRLHSLYYDTPEASLHAEGIALRVRRVGRRYVQTLKLTGHDELGLFSRDEVESPVPTSLPDPAAIPDASLRARVEQLLAGTSLQPVLETQVRRSERRLRLGESEILCDLDVGEIKTPRGALPICELELELLSGATSDLYALALELQETVPLRLAPRSKYERGWQHALGRDARAVRAARIELSGEATLEEALDRILRGCLAQVLANEPVARASVDPEGVHQMRVGVRRLRSALSLFREALPAEQIAPLRSELRWLAGELGGVRDLDVFLDETLEPVIRAAGPAELVRLRAEALRLRSERVVAVRTALDSPRYATLALGIAGWIEARGWREQRLSAEAARLFEPVLEPARELLTARRRRARRVVRDLAQCTPERRHALRIQLKKLRYACEFLRGAFPSREGARYIKALSRLQDALGRLNDVVAAKALLDTLLARLADEATADHQRAAGFVEGWVAREAEQEIARAGKGWRRLRQRPGFWKA